MIKDPPAPLVPGTAAFRVDVDAAITTFLRRQRETLAPMGPALSPLADLAEELLAGGKRLRPAFCAAGYLALAGQPDPALQPGLVEAAASLELLHVSALVHDDVMDASDLRRGRPAAHRQFEEVHRRSGWLGDAAAFGRAGAILLGDLLLMWSVEMLRAASLPAASLAAAAPIAEAMRTEVTGGQYLDVLAQVQPFDPSTGSGNDWTGPGNESTSSGNALTTALEQIRRVVEYKSARYTVQRPCQLGAALAGADAAQQAALAAFGVAVGRAFQYRDDLLGVFGDPAVTGKPAGDDLREGKRTVLIAHTYANADPLGQKLLRRQLGDPTLGPDGVSQLRELIIASGARDAVEQMITTDREAALAALAAADFTSEGCDALTHLAEAATSRTA